MKIDEKKSIPFKDLQPGDVFMANNRPEYYMKISQELLGMNSIKLADGSCTYFNCLSLVRPKPDALLLPEGKE